MKKLIALAIAMLFAGTVYAAEFADVSIADLKSAIAAKEVTVIDANGSKSYKKAHIPTAINFDAHQDNLASVLPKDRDALIVAYCGGPKCKAYKKAATAARELGYKNVKYFSEGISGWKSAGEKVESVN